MYNNTFFEYYRNAIKAKYDKEKDEDPSIALSNITTAKLRDLCIERLTINDDEDDLKTFKTFFKFEFDSTKKNLITGKTVDKLKKIRRFYLGITEVPTEPTIHFAAVLLDFQPRPFYRFCKVMEGKSQDEIIEELNSNYSSKTNNEGLDELASQESITKKGEIKIVHETESEDPTTTKNVANPIKVTEVPNEIKISFVEIVKQNKVSLIAIICLSIVAGYFIFFNKGCMQWSKDHYEVVDCKEGIEGNPNEIIVYDSHLLDFKKISVCDTTSWYVNGESIIWYGKTNNQVDFFSTCGKGRHPETKKTLRPLTGYIKGKYQSKDCASK
ncbi:hypothetical protein [Pseudomonas shirazensis]